MSTGTNRVFVYGSLKAGYWNCDRFLRGVPRVAEARTWELFYLQDGPYPYAWTRAPDGQEVRQVLGEVYDVDDRTLRDLDRLEGVPRHYQRILITVVLAGGSVSSAMMYVNGNELPRKDAVPCLVTERGRYMWEREQ